MITWIFPGQGSQRKGMGEALFREFSELVAQTDEILGYSIQTLCLENPQGKLNQTLYTQPALYIINALSFFQKTAAGTTLPNFVAGHSLGEYNALLAAGAFDFLTGLRLVQKRAELLNQASQTIEGAMAAVINLQVDELQNILTHNGLDKIDIANFNSPLQTVISGIHSDVVQAIKILKTFKDVHCLMLPVSGAFHSRYMSEAQQQFASFIQNVEFGKLKIPVISNVTARPYEQSEIGKNLIAQITHRVNWLQSMQFLLEQDDMLFEEVGPGNVLTKLTHKIKIDTELSAKKEVVKPKKEVTASSNSILPTSLDNQEFKQDDGIKYAHTADGIARGIASAASDAFKRFLSENQQCNQLYGTLSEQDELLAKSFEKVFEMHKKRLERYATDILSFLAQSEYGADYVQRFINRVRYLNTLQASFDANPVQEKLYDASAKVDRGDYNVALLLSIIISNHRTEIMQGLLEFISFIKKPEGRIASVGMGTGYELKLVHESLPKWIIEGYDTDEKAHTDARKLLHYFNITDNIRFGGLFPDDRPSIDTLYDAILLCELMEHLEDPSGFLKKVRTCLKPGGLIFVTMAVNIAQEDHIYLYASINDCRKQLADCGFVTIIEKIIPMTIRSISSVKDREALFQRGNYMAIVQ